MGIECLHWIDSRLPRCPPCWSLLWEPREHFSRQQASEGSSVFLSHDLSVCSFLPPVPRLLFEDWTYDDFRNVLDSEDEIEELSKTVVQVAKVRPECSSGPHGSHRPLLPRQAYSLLPAFLVLLCFLLRLRLPKVPTCSLHLFVCFSFYQILSFT